MISRPNGAAPSILGVFAVDNFYAHNNLANADRFITLFDHITDPLCVQGNLNSAGKLSKKLSLKPWFSGVAGTVASIASGLIYLLCLSLRDHNLISEFLRKYSDQIH